MKTVKPPASHVEPLPCVDQHTAEIDFVARGLRSGHQARHQDHYIGAEAVLAKLEERLAAAVKKPGSQS